MGETGAREVDLPIHVVARRLGVGRKTAQRMAAAGNFPGAYRREGRTGAWRVPETGLAEYRRQRATVAARFRREVHAESGAN